MLYIDYIFVCEMLSNALKSQFFIKLIGVNCFLLRQNP